MSVTTAHPAGAPADPAAVLAGLDPEQAQAASAPRGPVRILAGAGTGKTRAITHRIAHLALTGQVNPRQVLAVTHSARAAGEMRDRIAALGVTGVQARTFHAAALRQLSYFWAHANLPGERPTLVSSVRGGRYGMLRTALAATLDVRNNDIESTDVLDLDGEITWARARRVTAADYASAARTGHRERTQSPAVIAAAFARYQQTKRENAVLDFDDLLDACANMIASNQQVADQVRSQYSEFVVDEYQDTDLAQQRLLDAWLGERDTVTVVGDPFQRIYSFKGAEASLLTGFTHKYPHAVSVELVRDYRSTPQVVAAANRLMSKVRTEQGAGLVLLGQQPDGPDPRVRRYDTEAEEERGLAQRVRDLIGSGVPAAEIAVLHRYNSQAVRLEAALRDAGVEVMVADERFFDRPEVARTLTDLTTAAQQDPATPGVVTLAQVLAASGFDPENPPAGEGAARARWEALAALLDLAEHLPDADKLSVADLVGDFRRRAAEEHAPRRGGAVTVCTIHKAKGLEWDAVLVPRMTEGSLPSAFATTTEQLEEERRLAYVAITRARRILEFSCARERGDGGWRLDSSRFLSAIPQPQQAPASRRPGARTPSSRPALALSVGQRVVHDSHGMGTVVRVSETHAEIDFGSGTPRKVPLTDRKLDTL